MDRPAKKPRVAGRSRSGGDQLFRVLVDGVIDYAIYMLDPNGIVTTWNSGAERLKGYGATEIVGQPFSTFYTPEDRNRRLPAHALAEAERTGRYEAEGWRVRKDGARFWAGVVLDRIAGPDGRLIGFAKVTRDLTERKLAAERLEEARAALAQAQKMEAIGQLTGGIAHDFNNLLTVISGNAEIMLGWSVLDPAKTRHMLGGIQRAAERGAHLTQQLLAFARQQPLRPQSHSVRALLGSFEAVLRRAAGDLAELEFNLATGPDFTLIDGPQFEVALLNLVVNARDALPRGGAIRIGTRVESIGGAHLVAAVETGDYVVITVEDRGEGMTPETKVRAFEPFFTTKATGKGSGLGLSQVYGFVTQSGGQVRIDSALDVGTTITLYLPVDAAAQAQAAADRAAQRAGSAARVLVVEDDPDVMETAIAMLRQLGFEVLTAPEAVSALNVLRREPRIDVLFTDMVMPQGVTGIELARKARAMQPRLKVLLVSGFPMTAPPAELASDKDFTFVGKPYRWSEIAEILRGMMVR